MEWILKNEGKSHRDFKYEKSRVEQFIEEDQGDAVYLLPKFYCEMNPIECVWAQAKCHA